MLRLLISFTLWLLIHGSCTPEDLSIITIGVAYDTRWKKAYGSSSFQVINETINQANEILESSLFIRLRIGEVYYWMIIVNTLERITRLKLSNHSQVHCPQWPIGIILVDR